MISCKIARDDGSIDVHNLLLVLLIPERLLRLFACSLSLVPTLFVLPLSGPLFLGSSLIILIVPQKESSCSEPRCEKRWYVKQVEGVPINLIREQLAKCIQQNLLFRLAPTELAQEDQRPTSCRRLLSMILFLHQ